MVPVSSAGNTATCVQLSQVQEQTCQKINSQEDFAEGNLGCRFTCNLVSVLDLCLEPGHPWIPVSFLGRGSPQMSGL